MRETLKNQHFSHLIIMPQTGIEPVREYKSRRILSPVRLPVPPRRQRKNRTIRYFLCLILLRRMGGGGFEPPKQFAADLQSVPFGHSGIHPYFFKVGPIGLEPMTLCL